jgi:hypothetical protein
VATPTVTVDNTAVPATTTISATLAYTDNSSTEYKFTVRRAPVALNGTVGAYTDIGTAMALSPPTTGSSFVDASLAENNTYSYVVAAVGGYGEAVSAAQTVDTYAVPSAPVLSATSTIATQVVLTWTAGKPSTSYSIVRTGGAGPAVTFTAAAAATGYTDNTAVASTLYSYTVTVKNGGKSAVSNPATVTTPAAVLAAPSGLTATLASANSIALRWTDTTSVETGFAVWRADGLATPVQIATVTRSAAQTTATGGTVNFTNTNSLATPVVLGHTYTYYVKAISGAAVATPSNSVSVTVAVPDVPTALAYTVTPTRVLGLVILNRVNLSWTAGAAPVTSSQVQWSTSPTFATTLGTQNVNNSGTTAAVTFARNANTAYYFRVRSTNAVGTSVYSDIFPVTVAW